MRYTAAIVSEKVIEMLDIKPLAQQYADENAVTGFSVGSREFRKQDILYIQDNSGGNHPYRQGPVRHCLYIASRAEEQNGLPRCEPGRSLIVLPHTVKLRSLVSALEACFAFYNSWDDRLLSLVLRGSDWSALLEEGHRVLQNPMIIYNRSLRILAYTAQDGTGEPMWVDTVHDGVARADSVQRSRDLMEFLAQVEKHDAPFRFQGPGMSEPFWSAPVQVDGMRRGMVNVVEHHRPLSPGDRDLLRFFAEFVAIRMRQMELATPVPDAVPRQFMQDLLSGSFTSRDLMNTRLIAVGWQAQAWFRFVSFHAGLPFLSGEQWRGAYDWIHSLVLNGLCCMLGQSEPHIGLLLTAENPEGFSRALELIGQFCDMNPLRAGISDPYRDLLESPRFYRQAEIALELTEGPVCDYRGARYRRMLRHLRRHPYREDLMHPAVIQLKAIDEAEGATYIATLRTLIGHNYNQLETAEALGIHRTTLAYRLRRIQDLTGLDLSDAQQMFHVAVSLKLLGVE